MINKGTRLCKICKTRFKVKSNHHWCCNTDHALQYVRKQNKKAEEKKWKENKREMKQNLKRKQDYEKELETIFNTYIRERDKHLPCVSCDAIHGTYKLTAGHFFPAGSYKNVRFDEDNVHGQCWFNCNKNRHGNLLEYRPRLIQRIGQESLEDLERRAKESRHYSIPELIELKVIYKDKIKQLKNKQP